MIKKLLSPITPRKLKLGLNLWPPFYAAGIRVQRISPDWRHAEVTMRLHWYNGNFFGTHYGGSLFSMTDPFYPLMLLHTIGDDYYVWDRNARIQYLRPGKGRVIARFELRDEDVEMVLEHTRNGEKYVHEFRVDVVDESGRPIARLTRGVYVRKKAAAVKQTQRTSAASVE